MFRGFLGVFVVISFALPAYAESIPARKPGLWEITMHRDGSPMAAPASQLCLDAKTDAQLMKNGEAMANGMCDKPQVSGSGSTRVFDTVCHISGSTQNSHSVMTFPDSSTYHVDVTSTYAPPLYGKSSGHMTQDAKWVGPCPADMQPGDMMMNGMKMNILGMTSGALKTA